MPRAKRCIGLYLILCEPEAADPTAIIASLIELAEENQESPTRVAANARGEVQLLIVSHPTADRKGIVQRWASILDAVSDVIDEHRIAAAIEPCKHRDPDVGKVTLFKVAWGWRRNRRYVNEVEGSGSRHNTGKSAGSEESSIDDKFGEHFGEELGL